MATTLQLPIAIWEDTDAPIGSISKLLLTKNGDQMVVGFYDGKIYLCSINLDTQKMRPSLLLCGHETAIAGIAEVTFKSGNLFSEGPENGIVSASDDGILLLWDPRDGRCLKRSRAVPGKVTEFKTLRSERHIVACGQFPNIYIIDATTLSTIKVFPTKASGFVCCGSLMLYSDQKTLGEGFLTLSMSGMVECFSLRTNRRSTNPGPPIKPFQIASRNATTFHVNPFTNATVLLVSDATCEVFAMESFKYLLQIPCPDIQGWVGGVFCKHAEILLWMRNGCAMHYALPDELKLPTEGTPSLFEISRESQTLLRGEKQRGAPALLKPTLLRTFQTSIAKPLAQDDFLSKYQRFGTFAFDFASGSLVCADNLNFISIWSTVASAQSEVLPTIASTLTLCPSKKQSDFRVTPKDSLLKNLSCDLSMNGSHVALGYRSGKLVYTPMTEILHVMLEDNKRTSSDAHVPSIAAVKLVGHTAAVTCLLHPFTHGSPVDKNVIVSGSSDCTVRVWLAPDTLHHTFRNQAGEIRSLFCPPASSPLLKRGCFCSIALDHSLAIYSIDAKVCLHLFSGCCAPIQEIRWRCTDDYVCVWCDDGTAYVWQISTGHLDRKATGQLALDIMAQCDAVRDTVPVKNEQGIDLRLLDICPDRGKLPVLVLDIERLISSLSRRLTSEIAKQTSRNLLVRLLSILLHATDVDVSTQMVQTYNQLRLQYCTDVFTYGFSSERTGTYGLMLPTAENDVVTRRWCLSSYFTTALLVSTTALMHALHRTETDRISAKCWHFAMFSFTDQSVIQTLPGFKTTSLLQLALMWEHWQHDIQRVARAQLQSHLKHLKPDEQSKIVKLATVRLPSSVRDHANEEKLATAILLGVLTHVHPGVLECEHGASKTVADALKDIVENPNAATKHRAAAAEVLGKAYESFKQFYDLNDIFLILTELASTTTTAQSTVALHALKNLAVSNIHQFVEAVNKQMFNTSSGHFHGHNSMLKVLKILLKTNPEKLLPELPKVVDVVVRCFDPNTPKIRESCFKSAMGVFHEMQQVYPMMGLNDARLAVGCADGLINIYDLKSATRWQAIPAHAAPVTSIAFSHDGRMLASFSKHEKRVSAWHVMGSFFGMISSAPKCMGNFVVRSALDALTEQEAFDLTLVWTPKKVVRLIVRKGVEEEFKVS
eukprot:m.218955 g.218955  ORF g.218955 m.218955 type:complete len:1165 (-) comp33282_c0_seq1:144-3638(-)